MLKISFWKIYTKNKNVDQIDLLNGHNLNFYLEETKYNISKDNSILMVGCGNSAPFEQMVIIIFYLQTVVDRMQVLSIKQNMTLKYYVMDATSMQFHDKQFDIAFDKGTLIALSCGYDTKNLLLFKEMNRVTQQLIFVSHSSHQKNELQHLSLLSQEYY